MAKIVGYNGKVNFNATDYDIKSWTLDYSADMLEDTDTGDSGNRSYIAGLKGATGNFVIDYDNTQTPLTPGTSGTIKLYLDYSGTKYYQGTAIINSLSANVSVDGIETITYNFTISGALSYQTT